MHRRRRRHAGFPSTFGLLDVGTSKVACLVAATRPGGAGPAVLGFAARRSCGVKGGFVVDFDSAEAAIRAAVDAAEEDAGLRIGEVLVSVACGELHSRRLTANATLPAAMVTGSDVERALSAGRAYVERDGRRLVHLNKVAVRLDGVPASDDPCRMAARGLSADLHAVTADERAMGNLLTVVGRCHLDIAGVVAAPYASAIGCTTEEERRAGVTCVDIGAGATTIAVFRQRRFVHAAVVPVAGNHITHDIARALDTPLAKAGRIKALYGSLIETEADEHKLFSYPSAGEENGILLQASRASLARIIRPRVTSIARLVAEAMTSVGLASRKRGRIVITGGTAQLVGIGAFLSAVFGQPVRVAAPCVAPALPRAASDPAFSVVSGLLGHAARGGSEDGVERHAGSSAPGYLGRVGQWLRTGF